MGEVFLARDPLLERDVALKTIQLGSSSSGEREEARERFHREARITARLQHPHIVVVHEFGEEDQTLYLAMEYVAGGTLATRLASEGQPLSLAERVLLGAEVAEAIAHAHSKGVLHRDLKPANVLMVAPGFVKVSDFGIGKIMGDVDLTASGEMLGSPAYMSPEQMRGENLDARSDIFSFGILLFQLLTGRKPFQSANLSGLVAQIQNEDPPDVAALVPGTPSELSDVVKKCLRKDPGERYGDAEILARELHQIESTLANSPHAQGTMALLGVHQDALEGGQHDISDAGIPIEETETRVEGASPGGADSTEPTVRFVEPRSLRGRAGLALLGLLGLGFGLWALSRREPHRAPSSSIRIAARPAIVAPVPTEVAPVVVRIETPVPSVLKREKNEGKLLRVEAVRGVRLRISPDQCRVSLDGRSLGVADDWDDRGRGALLTFREPGRHRIRLSLIGYSDLLIDLLISPKAGEEIAHIKEEMLRDLAVGTTKGDVRIGAPDYRTEGSIRFRLSDPDALVTINGRGYGLASDWRGKDLVLKSPGIYSVILSSHGKTKSVRVLASPAISERSTVIEEKF